MKFISTFLLFLSMASFAAEKCEPALMVAAELTMTDDYRGVNWSYTHDGDKYVVILQKGKTYYLSADIELVKEHKSKCVYKAKGLDIDSDEVEFNWKSKKDVDARIELDKKGSYQRFHLNGFRPSVRRTVKDVKGKSKKTTFDGERPLYIGSSYKEMDDTSMMFEGPLAYFDFGDGHEYFGKAKVGLSKD